MTQAGRPAFWMAGLSMGLFIADIVVGAILRAAFLSDVVEALVLVISCTVFVAGPLVDEAKAKRGETSLANGEEETR